jgi:hypothetical protein
MKHTKLLFSISLLVFTANVKGQSTFLDSSTYYTYVNAPSVSQGLSFAHYIKETVNLDSTNANGYFYTVYYYASDFNVIPKFNTKYNLKCNGDKVYFTGKLRNDNNDSFEVSDLLIYDYSLIVGDTLKIMHATSGLKVQLIVDSIKNVVYQDNQTRETHYYTIFEGIPNEFYRNGLTLAANGLGSNFGLLPFKLNRRNAPFWQQLISVCKKNNNVVYSANDAFDHWLISNYCNELEIMDLIDTIRSLSIDKIAYQPIKVYPNPVNNKLFIHGISSGDYIIFNSVGQMVLEGRFDNYVNTAGLSNGIYYLLIKQDDKIYYSRFAKE